MGYLQLDKRKFPAVRLMEWDTTRSTVRGYGNAQLVRGGHYCSVAGGAEELQEPQVYIWLLKPSLTQLRYLSSASRAGFRRY